jgi:hypothetical protein
MDPVLVLKTPKDLQVEACETDPSMRNCHPLQLGWKLVDLNLLLGSDYNFAARQTIIFNVHCTLTSRHSDAAGTTDVVVEQRGSSVFYLCSCS